MVLVEIPTMQSSFLIYYPKSIPIKTNTPHATHLFFLCCKWHGGLPTKELRPTTWWIPTCFWSNNSWWIHMELNGLSSSMTIQLNVPIHWIGPKRPPIDSQISQFDLWSDRSIRSIFQNIDFGSHDIIWNMKKWVSILHIL